MREAIAAAKIPAAQYLRMSSEVQEFSLARQAASIQEYARVHGFTIVKTYQDSGRTGLSLKHRPGMQTLLRDVLTGNSPFRAILVHDISRWGRFQDCDEAAHYEFICKRAGVPVHYCDEPFANDGALTGMVVKSLKRALAAEYSRELGSKVLRGQTKLAASGFWMGAPPGYGLRRMLVSADGTPRRRLNPGEYKSISTDRIVLVPGPRAEVACVREICRLFLDHHRPSWIVRELKRKAVKAPGGARWTLDAVLDILHSPKYAGVNVWRRTTGQMGSKRRRLSCDDWVVKRGAFVPVVDPEMFRGIEEERLRQRCRVSDAELINSVSRLKAKFGYVSQRLIDRTRSMPAISTLYRHFGSMQRIYDAIGFTQQTEFFLRCARARQSQRMMDMVVSDLERLFPGNVSVERTGNRRRPKLRVDNCSSVSILICQHARHTSAPAWMLHPVAAERENITLVCLLNRAGNAVRQYYLFPCIGRVAKLHLTEHHSFLKTGRRLEALQDFYSSVVSMASKEELL